MLESVLADWWSRLWENMCRLSGRHCVGKDEDTGFKPVSGNMAMENLGGW
ncbi:MAG: hypothetical protein ACYTEX_09850 [Planctomycetota bacterium]